MVQGQLGQKVGETPFQPIAGRGGTCLSSQLCRNHKQKDHCPSHLSYKQESLFEKQLKQKRNVSMAQVVKQLSESARP
jgi:hypothetical protein